MNTAEETGITLLIMCSSLVAALAITLTKTAHNEQKPQGDLQAPANELFKMAPNELSKLCKNKPNTINGTYTRAKLSLLHMAVISCPRKSNSRTNRIPRTQYLAHIKVLIKAGGHSLVNRASGDKLAHSPLHSAVRHGDIDTVKLLLDAGANPSYKDSTGKMPVDYARQVRNKEGFAEILTLLGHSINPTQQLNNKTTSHSIFSQTSKESEKRPDNNTHSHLKIQSI